MIILFYLKILLKYVEKMFEITNIFLKHEFKESKGTLGEKTWSKKNTLKHL